jgi:hypothetical protein
VTNFSILILAPKPSTRKPLKSPMTKSPIRRTSKPTVASISGDYCPIVPTKGCSICGTNRCVTKPESNFSFSNELSMQCAILEQGALDGLVGPDICAVLPDYVSDICGCLDLKQNAVPPRTCPSIPPNGCSVCGTNKCISKPQNVFSFPNQPDLKCDLLQQAGLDGRINSDTCVQISELIQDVCGCTTPKPVPEILTICPKVPSNGCSVCGTDKCISKPLNVFSFPNQPDLKCDLLQQAGLDGRINSDTCVQISELIQDICGCTTPKPFPPLISSCPEVSSNGCSVCGTNKCISKPQNVFSFPNQPDLKCDLLQQAGLDGRINSDTCVQISELIQDVCGCTESISLQKPINTCPIVPENGCSVCGTDKCISKPLNVFSFPNQPDLKCDLLQQAGLDGRINSDTCVQISELIQDVCGCTTSSTITKPGTCPTVPSQGCSICGPGKCISTSNIFSFPGQPNISCIDLQRVGLDGVLDATDCTLLPSLVDKPCGCTAASIPPNSSSPFPTSGRPSRPPTLFVTPPPTTGRPTLLPTPPPTPFLSEAPLPNNLSFTVTPTNFPTLLPTYSPSTLSPATITTPFPSKVTSLSPTSEITISPPPASITQSPTFSTTIMPTSVITLPPSTTAPVVKSVSPSPAITPAPTSSIVSIACSPFQFQDGACSVCGSGMCVGFPNEIFSYPGQPSVTCGDLQLAGYDGQIPLSLCPFLPSIINTTCGCRF